MGGGCITFSNATTAVATRDHAGAIRDYDRAIQINPQYWPAWAMRGQTQIIGNIDRVAGIRDLQQAYRLCPDPAVKQPSPATCGNSAVPCGVMAGVKRIGVWVRDAD